MKRADGDTDDIAKYIARRGVTRCPPAEAAALDIEDGDYEMTIRVRNGRIMAAMRRAGIKSQSQLASLAGITFSSLNTIYLFLNFNNSSCFRFNASLIFLINFLSNVILLSPLRKISPIAIMYIFKL